MTLEEEMTLRELRKQSNKTVAEVATALGKSRQAIEHYENGKRQISLSDVLILKELYDCPAEEIIRAQLNNCPNTRQDNQ